MNKTDKLNQLFEEWENEVPEYKGKFIKDGINDEELFRLSKIKVLFIAKEPNNPKQQAGDFREWWKEGLKTLFRIDWRNGAMVC